MTKSPWLKQSNSRPSSARANRWTIVHDAISSICVINVRRARIVPSVAADLCGDDYECGKRSACGFKILFWSATFGAIARWARMHTFDFQWNSLLKAVATVTASALAAGLFVFLTAVEPDTNSPGTNGAVPDSFTDSGRYLALTRPACARHGWANFGQTCQFDSRRPDGAARTVRVLAIR
jgi:hypothetical protein